jgi:hypothetical protein
MQLMKRRVMKRWGGIGRHREEGERKEAASNARHFLSFRNVSTLGIEERVQ